MSDNPTATPSAPAPQTTKRRRKKGPSMWKDPVVATLGVIIGAIIIGTLAFVVIGLSRGVLASSSPKNAQEAALSRAKSDLAGNSDVPSLYSDYILQLIANKQYSLAEQKIAEGKKKFAGKDEYDQYMLTDEANLLASQKKTEEAIAKCLEAKAAITKEYKRLMASSEMPNKAKAYGYSDNYYTLELWLGALYKESKQYDKGIEELKAYLKAKPNESGVYIDLGNLQVLAGDKDAARKSYKKALKYVPNNQEAIDALKKIGEN